MPLFNKKLTLLLKIYELKLVIASSRVIIVFMVDYKIILNSAAM